MYLQRGVYLWCVPMEEDTYGRGLYLYGRGVYFYGRGVYLWKGCVPMEEVCTYRRKELICFYKKYLSLQLAFNNTVGTIIQCEQNMGCVMLIWNY